MIIRNKHTKETLQLTHAEFLNKFYTQIKQAFVSYYKTVHNKSYYKKPDKSVIEADFNANLQWNFNHLSNSAWYIEKL